MFLFIAMQKLGKIYYGTKYHVVPLEWTRIGAPVPEGGP